MSQLAEGRAPKNDRTVPTLLLVRHGKAENRERWELPDEERPLTRRGREQSRVIAGHLIDIVGRQPARILSSPAVRCSETVIDLAIASSLEVVETTWLGEGKSPDYAFDELRRLVPRLDPPSGVGGPVVACSHGDVIWGILERLARLGVDLGPQPDVPKGSVWIIEMTTRAGMGAKFYLPDAVRA